jgi:hypothetical protein
MVGLRNVLQSLEQILLVPVGLLTTISTHVSVNGRAYYNYILGV